MILATGVQLPNVLTEPVANTNIESDQFFSNVIEQTINDYQKRHPSDHYSALKQWKQKHVGEDFRFAYEMNSILTGRISIGYTSSNEWIRNINRCCTTTAFRKNSTIFSQCCDQSSF